jgi:hypothetical protein
MTSDPILERRLRVWCCGWRVGSAVEVGLQLRAQFRDDVPEALIAKLLDFNCAAPGPHKRCNEQHEEEGASGDEGAHHRGSPSPILAPPDRDWRTP